MHDALKDFLHALHVTVCDKLPEIARRSEELPGRAEDAKSRTAPEFDRLGGLDKMKAVAYLAENMNTLTGVPPFIKGAIAHFKEMYEEVLAMIKDISSSLNKLETAG